MTGRVPEKPPSEADPPTRFTLFSKHAEAVDLCLFDTSRGPERSRIPLTKDDSSTWSANVEGVAPGQLYGYRAHGPFDPRNGHRFNPAKLLVDPRALAVTGEPPRDDAFAGSRIDNPLAPDARDTGTIAPKSIVVDRSFDWGSDAPPSIPWEDTVIYECHVKGMSVRHPEVAEELRGTYLGLASEPVVDHLVRLGVTTIELLPVHQIASEPHLLDHGLTNFFGYSPLAFFAPHSGYARDPLGGQVREFKQMVRSLHRRGLEVLIDVVFNHTAEGDHRGRTLSLRGVDNRTYYRLEPEDLRRYRDFTGCGNTVATDNPHVVRLLIDCLRYWVEEMHVDGFRFDLAVSLGRTEDGFTPDAPFFAAIASDPLLAKVKLIAEPWDLGTDGYQRGRFPPGWLEWNDRFRDSSRHVWRGDRESARRLRSSFTGGPAPAAEKTYPRRPSIHFVTCHDGFTLEDLVSYEQKHNWANREENRDGSDNNLSRNWGAEGPTESTVVRNQRERAKRNLLTTLLLSTGVPMILYGDESNRSQRGNNNAYCQDNELTWLEWQPDELSEKTRRFIERVLALRKQIRPLSEPMGSEQQMWIGPDGRALELATSIREDAVFGLLTTARTEAYLILFNLSQRDRHARLPRRPASTWVRTLSTSAPGEHRLDHASYRLAANSMSVLRLEPTGSTGI